MFTFKKAIKTGAYRSFDLDYTDIKIKRKVVGYISENRDMIYRVGFAIKKEKTTEDPAPFKWRFLKKTFSSEQEARDFVNKKFTEIIETFDLYHFPD